MAKENIIVTRIYGAKAGDKEDMLSLIAQFKPLFNKYAYFLNNNDAFNDLQAFFIEFVKKVDLEKSIIIVMELWLIILKRQFIMNMLVW